MSSKDISINNVASSQVWKDLQRDSIVVNDERIVGDETGAEAMVGALMRHILDHADHIRLKYATEEARQRLSMGKRRCVSNQRYHCGHQS